MKAANSNKFATVAIWLPSLIFWVSCNNQYDAENAAKDYCKCMKQNNAVEDFNKASAICDDQLNASNRYIKLWTIDMSDRELDKKISDATRDSVKAFMDVFIDYTNQNCCKETLACPDPEELK